MSFIPVGNKARWKYLYDLLVEKNIGDIITYTEAASVLSLNVRYDRNIIQSAMKRAAHEYELTHKRAIEVIRGEGYRVVEPERHLVLARQFSRKAARATQQGMSKVINVDLNGVDPEIRAAFDLTARAFAQQMAINHQMNRRVTDVSKMVVEVSKRSEAQTTELRDRLARLEREIFGAETALDKNDQS